MVVGAKPFAPVGDAVVETLVERRAVVGVEQAIEIDTDVGPHATEPHDLGEPHVALIDD
jgi:hypothetical protein